VLHVVTWTDADGADTLPAKSKAYTK
jgi:hypothetical protein